MNKKVSIVMAYYNRLEVLMAALKTISMTKYDNVEVILVDDGSDISQRCEGIEDRFDLDIRVLRIDKEKKTWTNPCISFNKGFQQASGDIVIIQNPECLHIGDVVSYVVNNLSDKNYLTLSCYSINSLITTQLLKIKSNVDYIDKIRELVEPYMKSNVVISNFTGWYNHPTVRPYAYHFCSAITKKNIDDLGGFDERYSLGFGFDDNELLTRIKRKGLRVEVVSPKVGVYTIHQYHSICTESRSSKSAGVQRNCKLYHEVTLKETGWKVNVGG